MSAARLTSKGQITLPKSVRDRLHLAAGDRVEFIGRLRTPFESEDFSYLDYLAHRGIHATLYGRLKPGVDASDLQGLYEKRYAGEAFVDVMPAGSHPETRSVRASNLCRIAVHRPQGGDTVVVLSVIDNLVKGAAGQAIQNLNIMFGFDEEAGLDIVPVSP